MPPKARIVRKNTATVNNKTAPSLLPPANVVSAIRQPGAPLVSSAQKPVAKEGAMLPPPDPQPPKAILEAEFDALSSSLRTAAVKTGQIYGFYADSTRLGIQNYAPHPPQSLTAALGREVERYDQLCDTMESQLLRAIAVLQRDLDRSKAQIQAAAEAEAFRNQPKPEPTSPTLPPLDLPELGKEAQGSSSPTASMQAQSSTQLEPPISPMDLTISTPQASPPLAGTTTSARRHSTISLSSLNRPQFPHKLDLSAAALRINPGEISQGLGLASPVTLAPKSGRLTAADEFPPDFMAAIASAEAANRPVDIDLTSLPDSGPSVPGHMPGNVALGSSADRPIELDLDSMDMDIDLFGDDVEGEAETAALLASTVPSETAEGKKKADVDLDTAMFGSFSSDAAGNAANDLFAAFVNSSQSQGTASATFSAGAIAGLGQPGASSSSGPSATAILEGFATTNTSSAPANQTMSNGDAPFDLSGIDFASFPSLDATALFPDTSNQNPDMTLLANMEALLNMGGVEGVGNSQTNGNQSSS
ncbi:hypothetical protein FA95DRAFT_262211 [Auriscalpium vulgare]|uniref:Uncharacterized protein n=1 Tax=Auriscalpium vulgare TaxID=40419 RepID=A0ACB8RKI1_9AGAM|nr:hypothetical protein FA95DRAFT_262211 [Auriscalpium vulgare]